MRILADAAIFNDEGKILLIQQTKNGRQPFLWGLPGGHVEKDENPEEAAIREVKEETNLDISLTNFVHAEILYVSDGSEYLLVTYKAKSRDLNNIKIDSKEVNDYGWFSLKEIRDGKIKLRGDFLLPPLLKAFSPSLSTVDSFSISYYNQDEAAKVSV